MQNIYTIGYTAFDIEDFIKVLEQYKIKGIIDVRSNPVASEFYSNYSKTQLEPVLKKNGIFYRNYAKEFGARQTDKAYYTNNYVDFEKFTKSDIFNEGINKINKCCELNYQIALMCAEKDPIACHRTIMISRALKDMSFNILHIKADRSVETQNEIEQRLLNIYFPNRAQLNLFNAISETEQINEAYKLQNQKIAYRIE